MGLKICQFYDLIHGCGDAIGVLAAGIGKVGLTTATALDELGGFAHHLSGIQLMVFHQVIADGHIEHGLTIVNGTDDDEGTLGLGSTYLEGKVLGLVGTDGQHGGEHLDAVHQSAL